MANYSLVVDSVYNPFTFDELIKPYQMYGQAYKEQEDRYNQLAEDSAKWGDQLKPDSEAYKMWNEFQTNVSDAANQLITQGLTPATRGKMTDVRRSYGKNIKAIEAANTEYQKAQALRNQVMGNDDSVRYKTQLSLDDFLHGKQGSTEHLSGTKLRTETADMAERLGKAIYSSPSFNKVLDDYYWQIKQANGANPDMLSYILDGAYENIPHGEDASDSDKALYKNMKEFATIYQNQAKRTQGYSSIDQEDLMGQVFQGMYAGLAKPAYDYQRNLGKMSASEAAADKRARESLAFQKSQWEDEKKWRTDPNNPASLAGRKALIGAKAGSGSSTGRSNRLSAPVQVSVDGKTSYFEKAADIPGGAVLVTDVSQLGDKQKTQLKSLIGDDLDAGYDIYVYDDDFLGGSPDWDDSDDIIVVPRKTTVVGASSDDDDDL